MFRLRGTLHMCVFRAVVLQHFKMLFRLARRLGAWPNRESIAIYLLQVVLYASLVSQRCAGSAAFGVGKVEKLRFRVFCSVLTVPTNSETS